MASNDPGPWTATATTVTAVEHTEGTSYLVAVGDPAAFPFPGSDHYHCRDFPAAGGENPYEPERELLQPLVGHLNILGDVAPDGAFLGRIANALCVSFYETLRRVPERSRGLDFGTLLSESAESNFLVEAALTRLMEHDRRAPGPGGGPLFTMICLVISFYRMCYRDGTLQAFTERPDVENLSMFDIGSLYFNLSARERARLRDYAKSVRRERRMPTILARQLIIRKVDKKKLHGQLRRLVYGLFMTESDELFRVVVSFL